MGVSGMGSPCSQSERPNARAASLAVAAAGQFAGTFLARFDTAGQFALTADETFGTVASHYADICSICEQGSNPPRLDAGPDSRRRPAVGRGEPVVIHSIPSVRSVMSSKVLDLATAIRDLVHDDDTVVMEGFTHLIPFAAAHEIIRQRRRNLTLVRLTPDLIYDQLISAGCCRKLIFSWAGNPGIGSLHAFRKAVERGALDIEEYSHFGLAMRLFAGAARLPFMPLRSALESDLVRVNPSIRPVVSPFGGEELCAVPPLRPDVAILHAQRADEDGNVQIWGLTGAQREAAFASSRVIVTVEEIVPRAVVRADPNRTAIPGMVVSAVCPVPFGAHPSYAQGYYDRDNDFYIEWDDIGRDESRVDAWLDAWVRGMPSRAEYVRRLGPDRLRQLSPTPRFSGPVNYGRFDGTHQETASPETSRSRPRT
jgi:glutaconate CoA-transferase subunit A